MKIIDFYSGFAGEKEIRLYCGNTVLSVWEGYFSSIMNAMLEIENSYKDSAFGIAAEWTTLTGWCSIDSKKTRVQNSDDEIEMLSKFNIHCLESSEYKYLTSEWKEKISSVHKSILNLFEKAKKNSADIYIQEY